MLWTVGRSFPTIPCYQELTETMRVLKPEANLSARLEELWYEDYIAGLWIDGTNHYSHTTGDCENGGSPTVWLGHDVSAYFKKEGEKSVVLALIQGGDLGGGTVRTRIRFDPSYALVSDTREDDPACMDLVHAIGDGACEGAIQCAQIPEQVDPSSPTAASRSPAGASVPRTCCRHQSRGSPASAGTSP